ncbi:MAG: AmmeMemoRadiSam system protein A [Bacteroidales bacterium]|nr:AmmeMemoRadiSam system protein A [Bacteroidales bacterium]
MKDPLSPYTRLARNVIGHYLKTGSEDIAGLPPMEEDENFAKKLSCFVTLHNKDGSLRGCIGTIKPAYKNLYEEIKHNALSAAFRDSRFPPLKADEFNDIILSVDILSKPEKINDFSGLDPSVFGVIVSDGFFHKAVLLPGIETIKAVEEQVNIVKKKAGLENVPDHRLTFYRFSSTRYF